jgi:putative ABC transport system permease protein
VKFELSYDVFNTKADHIYRVVCDIKTLTEVLKFSVLPRQCRKISKMIFRKSIFTRALGDNILVRKGNIKFQKKIHCGQILLFSVFDFKLVKGNPKTALKNHSALCF